MSNSGSPVGKAQLKVRIFVIVKQYIAVVLLIFQSTLRFTSFLTFSLHHGEEGERCDHVSDPKLVF